MDVNAAAVARHSTSDRSGQPLDPASRALMEPRFQHNFSHIRIHADAEAAESASAQGAMAYTLGSHVVFGAGQHNGTREGRRLLAHELAHIVQQDKLGTSPPGDSHEREAEMAADMCDSAFTIPIRFPSAPGAIQRKPDTGSSRAPASSTVTQPAASRPAMPIHSLKVQIRIADDMVIVDEHGKRRWAGLFATMPRALSKRLIDQVKFRLAFLTDEGFRFDVEFGQFSKSDLKIPGNIQVWLIDELDEASRAGEIAKKQYGYPGATRDAINDLFKNVTSPGLGEEFKEVSGLTQDQIDDSVPGTDEPVFIKIPSIFSRDELWHYAEGKKQEAELGVDEISATLSHELGHVLRAYPAQGHGSGTFNNAKQSLPPHLMDTVGSRGGWTTSEGFGSPRLSTEPNDTLSEDDVTQLGGWEHVWHNIVLPNVGDDKAIRKARVIPEKRELQMWYNFRNIGYTDIEKHNMIEFLKGIEMSVQNNKWKRGKG